MKRLNLMLLIFVLFLVLNACYKTENDPPAKEPEQSVNAGYETEDDLSTNGPDETVFQGITLSRQDHPELNFDYSEHDGRHAIRDFTVTPEGNLLLLELSKCIYEYSPQGRLLNIYEYDLEEQGLTAYMFAADDQGNFYLLDGRRQLIIKVNKSEILNLAAFDETSLISDTGLIKSFYADSEDVLIVTALDTSDFSYHTFTLDVSGDNIKFTEDPVRGDSIGNRQFVYVEHIMDGEQLTNGMEIVVAEYGGEERRFRVYTNHEASANLVGFQIYGLMEEGKYLARAVETLHGDKVEARENFLILEQDFDVTGICESNLAASDIIRGFQGDTFVLRFTNDGLEIVKLYDLCSSWKDDVWFYTDAI
ncbi:MAG: hypothetical protein GX992_04725 [Clostridium sp.]|nr:hypothetical protein [Clostridium sp.]